MGAHFSSILFHFMRRKISSDHVDQRSKCQMTPSSRILSLISYRSTIQQIHTIVGESSRGRHHCRHQQGQSRGTVAAMQHVDIQSINQSSVVVFGDAKPSPSITITSN